MNIMNLGSTRPIIPNDSALSAFKANLVTDGTYTSELSVLDSCFQAIPDNFRNSDVFMLAGAYKSGQIACYDNLGNIIDLGFSRNNGKYGFSGNYVPKSVVANTPLIDNHYYSKVNGYVIETAGTNDVTNNSSGYGQGGTMTQHDTYQSIVGGGTGAFTTARLGTPLTIPASASYSFWINKGTMISDIITLRNGGTGVMFTINFQNKTVVATAPTNNILDSFVFNGNFVMVQARTNTQISGFWFGTQTETLLTSAESFSWGYLTSSHTRTPIMSVGGVAGTSEADTIVPFTLASSAKVCVLTNKGVNVISAPSGLFDIMPYINNSKLRLFTIKYD